MARSRVVRIVVANILYGLFVTIISALAFSLLIKTTAVMSVAISAVALSGPTVANELVEVPISAVEDTGFALEIRAGGSEVLTPYEANAA